jgi:hypothetical protein
VIASLVLLAVTASAPSAQAVILTHVVGPMDNLYNTAWVGNPFPGAVGTGTDAQSVSSGGAPFDFSGYSSIAVSTTGCIVDRAALCTDADGFPADGLFRGLTVYSMIGLWSSTGSSITGIGVPFVVGTAALLPVPVGPAFLFLAENDGIFRDNSGQYDVTIEAVPEPGTLSLVALGGLLFGVRRRRRNG